MCFGRFVEETVIWVLVLFIRTVIEAITESPVVNTSEPSSPVWPRLYCAGPEDVNGGDIGPLAVQW
jgi:hypothetical protein